MATLALGLAGSGAYRLLSQGSRPQASPAEATNLDADTVTLDRTEIDLGRVPLNKVVPVSVTLTNQSRREVSFGQATVETLEGC